MVSLRTGQRGVCDTQIPSPSSSQPEFVCNHCWIQSGPNRWPHPVTVSHASTGHMGHSKDRSRLFTALRSFSSKLCAETSSYFFVYNGLSSSLSPSRRLARSSCPNMSLTRFAAALRRTCCSVWSTSSSYFALMACISSDLKGALQSSIRQCW